MVSPTNGIHHQRRKGQTRMTDEELEAYYQKRTMTITVNDAVMSKSIYDKPKKHNTSILWEILVCYNT